MGKGITVEVTLGRISKMKNFRIDKRGNKRFSGLGRK